MNRLAWLYLGPLFAVQAVAAWIACINDEAHRSESHVPDDRQVTP